MVLSAQKQDSRCEDLASGDITDFLRRPETHPDRPSHVECVETHISWVFLTRRFAYKLKKPVRFPFLDFSTLEMRQQACREELRLNRRLAPDIYLEVVPVTKILNRLSLGGREEVVDWVVKMRRLPADRSLDRLIESGGIKSENVDQVAEALASFYEQLPPVPIKTNDYRDEISRHVRDNELELLAPRHELDPSTVKRVHEAQRRLLTLWPKLLDSRVLDGRIVDGHGDLRPEHVYLLPKPVVIDCIEFNSEFRILDVADELSFLAMECENLSADWVGRQVFQWYRARSGDQPDPMLIAFYKCYRACVRAKVAALRTDQLAGEQRGRATSEARRYLTLAERYARSIGRPLLIIVRGRSGTGKSTVATAIAARLGISLLQTDAIRRDLLGESTEPAGYGQGKYAPELKSMVYRDMFAGAKQLLRAGRSAVLDGTFLAANCRKQALEQARRQQAIPLFVECTCPEAVAKQRIAERAKGGETLSEASAETASYQAIDEQPDSSRLPGLRLDTTEPLPALLDMVIAAIAAAN